jgi:pre-mRNA-splicing factor CWC22
VFKYDDKFEENEEKYKDLRKTILDENSDDDEMSSSDSDDVDEEEQEVNVAESKSNYSFVTLNKNLFFSEEQQQTIIDQTETNLVTLRRTIYLAVQSSIGAEECAHKLLKINLRPGQEVWCF